MTTLPEIVDVVRGYAPNADIDQLMRAYLFSARAHNGQLRKSGEPYFIHPLAVAGILADLRMDIDTISVGLLHDTMEDCLCTAEELTAEFGPQVGEMVDGVTKIGKLNFRTKQEAQAENFRKLVLAMARDVRVILVKLADRLHNMRTMQHMKPTRQVAISEETMDIYVPIANRLGLSKLKMELEDLCFSYLHPAIYQEMQEDLGVGAEDRKGYIERACTELKQQFDKHCLQAKVYGRPKHLYSIYRKMRSQNLEFEQIHDLLAFRVFVDDVAQCYTALGVIHSLFRHVPERLKDYIANPKSNGYQSLHTVVMGPENQQIEIQIRTYDMHHVAEVGIAAHWRYKEGRLALSREDINKIAKLRELFEAAKEVSDPTEFLETIKIDLFSNELFVFTPKGDVKFFAQGSTVLDFAYSIHTQVGRSCAGARVNGRMVPLRYQLRSGDTIEIIRRAGQKPSRAWLDIAKTGRALSKIRRQIREEEREKGRVMGREMLQHELGECRMSLNRQLRSGKLDTVSRTFGFRKPEQLYLALAQGNVSMNRVLKALVPEDVLARREAAETEPDNALSRLIHKLRKRPESPVLISGEEGVLVSYGRCCNPLPGEPVSGFITRGRGITIHVMGCRQLLSLDPDRRIKVEWRQEARGSHTSEIRIVCSDKPGMLAEIGGACKVVGVNVSRMDARGTDDGKAILSLEVSVADVNQLTELIRSIERIKGVLVVERVREESFFRREERDR